MSKAVSKIDSKNQHSLQNISKNVPSINVKGVPVPSADNNIIITAYKDLNQPLIDFAANQQKHIFIVFFVFIALGFGILMGQHFTR